MIPVALTIAGSDPSGGAGIQADLKTFHHFEVYGEAVITLLTVQNTRSVSRVEWMPAGLVMEQLTAVLEDIPPQAIKTGALGNAAIIEALAHHLPPATPVIVDPVMISKHGAALLSEDAVAALTSRLLPRAALVTPNLAEASAMAGFEVKNPAGMREACRRIADFGVSSVLVKGGHLESGAAIDVLFSEGAFYEFTAERIETRHTHGTGCTYSAAIAALLARGADLPAAVEIAKKYISEAIRSSPGLGAGNGPVNHQAAWR